MSSAHRRHVHRAGIPTVLAVLFSTLALIACAARRAEETPDPRPPSALTRIFDQLQIRVGMSGEQPPLTMTAKSGELFGLDVALSRVLAQSMGVEAVFVRMPFAKLLDALEAGEIDMVMSGMTITPARSRRATFIGPYFTSGKSLLTKSEELAKVKVPQDLDTEGLRLVALEGSTSEGFVRKRLPKAALLPSPSLDEAIRLVLEGTVDALVADRETCHFAVLRHPDAGLFQSEAVFTVEPMGIAVGVDDTRLARLIGIYLEALEDRGVLQQARDFWFRDPSWVKSLR
jgi:polar amino acid transport system substrate-binding protein